MSDSGSSRDPFAPRSGRRGKPRGRSVPPQLQANGEKPPKGKKQSIGPALILVAVTVLIGGLALFYFYLITPPPKPKPAQTEEENLNLSEDYSAAGYDFLANEKERNILYIKPDFAVNLRGLDRKVLFRVKIRLEVDSMAVAEELNTNPAKFYEMIDDITRTLAEKSYAELVSEKGMELLKMQLKDHINERYLTSGSVVRVIFENPTFRRLLPRIKAPQQ